MKERIWSSLIVAGLAVALASCDQSKPAQPVTVSSGSLGLVQKADFKDWPEPAVAFVLTGEMHGYIEPCGCSEPQYGGIARRASLMQQLRDKKWPLAALDVGGTLSNETAQSKLKFQTLLGALREMRYSSLQIGTEELRLGPADLVSSDVVPEEGQPTDTLRLLGANVLLFGSEEFATPVRHQLIKVGALKIGVTGVIGATHQAKLGMVDETSVKFTDPAKAIETALKSLKEQHPDLLVLVSHATADESRQLVEKFPEFNLALTTGGEEPLVDNPVTVGKTLLVSPGHKGKFVALLGYYPQEETQKYRFDLVRLDGDRFKNDPKMIQHMQLYQDLLKDGNLIESEPAIKHDKGTYVGAQKCGECHTKAFAKWKESKHSHAFESLKTGRLGISRIYDPECIGCHTVGWKVSGPLTRIVSRFESSYVNDTTAHLKGVQCENCHGPGSEHIALIEADKKAEASKLMRVTLEDSEKNQCRTCHDGDNSPKFKFEDYWPQIAHPGKD